MAASDFVPTAAFTIKQVRVRWDDAAKVLILDVPDIWLFQTIQEAQIKYQDLKLALAKRGFIYSDMDW